GSTPRAPACDSKAFSPGDGPAGAEVTLSVGAPKTIGAPGGEKDANCCGAGSFGEAGEATLPLGRAAAIKALRALSAGCCSCGRGAPGRGGRSVKSGGTTRGALLATTANSSGGRLVRPSSSLTPSQAQRATGSAVASSSARAFIRFIP